MPFRSLPALPADPTTGAVRMRPGRLLAVVGAGLRTADSGAGHPAPGGGGGVGASDAAEPRGRHLLRQRDVLHL